MPVALAQGPEVGAWQQDFCHDSLQGRRREGCHIYLHRFCLFVSLIVSAFGVMQEELLHFWWILTSKADFVLNVNEDAGHMFLSVCFLLFGSIDLINFDIWIRSSTYSAVLRTYLQGLPSEKNQFLIWANTGFPQLITTLVITLSLVLLRKAQLMGLCGEAGLPACLTFRGGLNSLIKANWLTSFVSACPIRIWCVFSSCVWSFYFSSSVTMILCFLAIFKHTVNEGIAS